VYANTVRLSSWTSPRRDRREHFLYSKFCNFSPLVILHFVIFDLQSFYLLSFDLMLYVWFFAIGLSAISHLLFGYSSFGYLPFSYIIVFTCLIHNGRRISGLCFFYISQPYMGTPESYSIFCIRIQKFAEIHAPEVILIS
jgi:hypothetical protein